MQKKKGYSLTEILIVLAILTILASGAYVIYKFINEYKVYKVAYELASDLEYAKSLAFERGGANVTVGINYYEIIANGTVLRRELPQGITLSINITPPIVEFKRNKLPKENGHITVSGFGKVYKIFFDYINGRIRVESE